MNILGNHEVLQDLIAIATGDSVEPRIVSKIEQIAEEIQEKMKDMSPEEKKEFIKKMREEHANKREKYDKGAKGGEKEGGVDPVRP